jgi:hypothetical protein
MKKEYFDIDRIVTIYLAGERPNHSFVWENEKPIKYFFGLIDSGRFTPEGYYKSCSYDSDCYTEEELINYGYLVKDKIVYDKPYVKIDLEHDNSVNISFETEAEMKEWVNKIIEKSKKTFEVIDYEK